MDGAESEYEKSVNYMRNKENSSTCMFVEITATEVDIIGVTLSHNQALFQGVRVLILRAHHHSSAVTATVNLRDESPPCTLGSPDCRLLTGFTSFLAFSARYNYCLTSGRH